eukprot:886533-Prymnesium_polylepis.1
MAAPAATEGVAGKGVGADDTSGGQGDGGDVGGDGDGGARGGGGLTQLQPVQSQPLTLSSPSHV